MPDPGLRSLQIRPGNPDFMDLPWALPLEAWTEACARTVQLPRGLSRHEVQFLSYGAAVYVCKELGEGGARREYELLLEMEASSLPCVSPVGHATVGRENGDAASVLITRFLDGSHPYRNLFQNPGLERYRERLLDAMAGLVVRLHVGGVFWGDCSLSNTLFRRDAGRLGAYMVDAETSEIHEQLSDGQRRLDLMILEENVTGDLMDLSMATELPRALQPEETGPSIVRRYEGLWSEITREVVIVAGESWRIQERVRALNKMGFSVGEIELVPTGDGDRLRVRTVVTDRDHHRHSLHDLTGLVAQERQAELMLNEIRETQAHLARELNRSVPLSVAAFRWLTGSWEPARERLTPLETEDMDAAQHYCQVLENKWYLSEQARKDVGLERALEDYLEKVGAEREPNSGP
ncbi:MAG: DUF4032 domain-containing protein [Candidatus Eisenbacteria bacterium]|nr:DUF4032 domain-containing protein [Candidatus Eisenbacteria bacterium]